MLIAAAVTATAAFGWLTLLAPPPPPPPSLAARVGKATFRFVTAWLLPYVACDMLFNGVWSWLEAALPTLP